MATNGLLLPPNKLKALTALLENSTITAAAEAAGVGHRTLTRWMAVDDEFKRALREAQTRALQQTITRLSGAGPTAANVLTEIACDPYAPHSVRVQAASRILSEQRAGLNMGALRSDLDDLWRIVDELEKRD
jgi:hypothetical protein